MLTCVQNCGAFWYNFGVELASKPKGADMAALQTSSSVVIPHYTFKLERKLHDMVFTLFFEMIARLQQLRENEGNTLRLPPSIVSTVKSYYQIDCNEIKLSLRVTGAPREGFKSVLNEGVATPGNLSDMPLQIFNGTILRFLHSTLFIQKET